MTTLRWCLASFLLAAGSLPLHRATAQSASDDPDSAAARAARGRILFEGKGLCFSCHGKDGEGLLGPTTKLAGRPLVHAKPTLVSIAALVTSGVDSAHSTSGQVMPPKGGSRLTDSEIQAVAEYVLQLQAGKKPE
jgi:mono/diheme cytochrome c family protein